MANFDAPRMNRRHFLEHVSLAAGTTAAAASAFLNHLEAHAAEVKRHQKACILMWMGGGPPTIDLFDMKPGSKNGGEFKPIAAKGGLQVCEHLPKTAQIMDRLAIVRSMSTREADHNRGRYYLHTSFVPDSTITHPTFGAVASHELGPKRAKLEIPAFVSIGGPSEGAGFLGMSHAPFVVDGDGRIRNATPAGGNADRMKQRLVMLDAIETDFIHSKRGEIPQAHKDVYARAVNLMSSAQMQAFRVDEEQPEVRTMYGNSDFGRGLLMARRLVETGVPFIEVSMNGWDLHQNVFDGQKNRLLPMLDQGMSALVNDLVDRGLYDHTVLVWMGEFGRTPRINQNTGRDHWATSWSVVLGGGGLKTGQAIGETDADGLSIVGKSYLPGDIWATVAQALGIPLDTVFKPRGRIMKVVNGGTPIAELVG